MRKTTITALVSTALLTAVQFPSSAQVDETIKSGTEINEISQRTTLLIVALNGDAQILGNGSGSLIAREGDTCVGVTNEHVIRGQSNGLTYAVRTFDGEVHPVEAMRPFAQEDLAIVTFECEQDYEPITLATYQLSPGQEVYLSGWPSGSAPGAAGSFVRQFTSGSISTLLERPVAGYEVGYTNVTRGGMSGGQVLDQAGRLVAIHGMGITEDVSAIADRLNVSEDDAAAFAGKTGFNYGIPVSTFLAGVAQSGRMPSLDVVYSTPQNSGNGSTVSGADYDYEPDASDRVSRTDILDDLDRVLDVVGRVCRFIGC